MMLQGNNNDERLMKDEDGQKYVLCNSANEWQFF